MYRWTDSHPGQPVPPDIFEEDVQHRGTQVDEAGYPVPRVLREEEWLTTARARRLVPAARQFYRVLNEEGKRELAQDETEMLNKHMPAYLLGQEGQRLLTHKEREILGTYFRVPKQYDWERAAMAIATREVFDQEKRLAQMHMWMAAHPGENIPPEIFEETTDNTPNVELDESGYPLPRLLRTTTGAKQQQTGGKERRKKRRKSTDDEDEVMAAEEEEEEEEDEAPYIPISNVEAVHEKGETKWLDANYKEEYDVLRENANKRLIKNPRTFAEKEFNSEVRAARAALQADLRRHGEKFGPDAFVREGDRAKLEQVDSILEGRVPGSKSIHYDMFNADKLVEWTEYFLAECLVDTGVIWLNGVQFNLEDLAVLLLRSLDYAMLAVSELPKQHVYMAINLVLYNYRGTGIYQPSSNTIPPVSQPVIEEMFENTPQDDGRGWSSFISFLAKQNRNILAAILSFVVRVCDNYHAPYQETSEIDKEEEGVLFVLTIGRFLSLLKGQYYARGQALFKKRPAAQSMASFVANESRTFWENQKKLLEQLATWTPTWTEEERTFVAPVATLLGPNVELEWLDFAWQTMSEYVRVDKNRKRNKSATAGHTPFDDDIIEVRPSTKSSSSSFDVDEEGSRRSSSTGRKTKRTGSSSAMAPEEEEPNWMTVADDDGSDDSDYDPEDNPDDDIDDDDDDNVDDLEDDDLLRQDEDEEEETMDADLEKFIVGDEDDSDKEEEMEQKRRGGKKQTKAKKTAKKSQSTTRRRKSTPAVLAPSTSTTTTTTSTTQRSSDQSQRQVLFNVRNLPRVPPPPPPPALRPALPEDEDSPIHPMKFDYMSSLIPYQVPFEEQEMLFLRRTGILSANGDDDDTTTTMQDRVLHYILEEARFMELLELPGRNSAELDGKLRQLSSENALVNKECAEIFGLFVIEYLRSELQSVPWLAVYVGDDADDVFSIYSAMKLAFLLVEAGFAAYLKKITLTRWFAEKKNDIPAKALGKGPLPDSVKQLSNLAIVEQIKSIDQGKQTVQWIERNAKVASYYLRIVAQDESSALTEFEVKRALGRRLLQANNLIHANARSVEWFLEQARIALTDVVRANDFLFQMEARVGIMVNLQRIAKQVLSSGRSLEEIFADSRDGRGAGLKLRWNEFRTSQNVALAALLAYRILPLFIPAKDIDKEAEQAMVDVVVMSEL